MRKLVVLGMILLGPAFPLWAGDGKYAVSLIEPSLLKNSNMIKRLEEEQFMLKNPGEAYYKLRYVLTILNGNADPHAAFAQHYNKFIDIRSIDGWLYDAAGKELRRLKNKDLRDISGVSDDELMDDTRYKVHNFYCKVYPYTVEYEVELRYTGTMFYPDWFPQSESLMGVENSSFTFSCPENYEFRYKAYNFSSPPLVKEGKGIKSYTWEIRNLPAIVKEPYAPGLRKITPLVLFGPTRFEMQDYTGNMKSWQDLGKFIYSLKQGRDVLPDDVKRVVHEMTDKETDPVEKIRILYEYLQQNTRYISIQLGIGGWQPFDAKFVASKKYGDCKALSNYMFSLLKEAGIRSNYTVIAADREDIFADFPSSQFNHVILCVPMQKDTIWLECTSPSKAAGYLGEATANRYALLIDEEGGKLVRTPDYRMNDNRQERYSKARLDENGTLVFTATTHYTGLQQEAVHSLINHLSKDKVKQYLGERLDFATYDVTQFKYKENKKIIPSVEESLNITVSNYAAITGKRLFIAPNIMTRSYRKPDVDPTRKFDIELPFGYKNIDTVEIELPAGYTPESLPQDIAIQSPFGKYRGSVKIAGNKLTYYRDIEYASGRFPPKAYDEMIKFYGAIYKADRNRVVLIKEAD